MSRARRLVGLVAGGLIIAPLVLAPTANADPSAGPTTANPPSGSATTVPSSTASSSETASASPSTPLSSSAPASAPASASSSSSTASGSPSASVSSSPSSTDPGQSPAAASAQQSEKRRTADDFTLAISSIGSPQRGKFFQDIGSFGLSGAVADRNPGQKVEIWRRGSSSRPWGFVLRTTTGADRQFSASTKVTWSADRLEFCATLGGSPATSTVIKTCPAPIRVEDAKVTIAKPVRSINSLNSPLMSGTVYPARPGVKINLDVKRSNGQYRVATTATTGADGRWRVRLGYERGSLKSYRVRAAYRAANTPRWETSGSQTFARVAVLDAKIARTTGADVAKTYRSGCPVGPSKLRTISINYYGLDDHKMHRGVIIIKSSLTDDLIRGFGAALKKRYPIAKMNNPNVYGGNDPRQMEANNTSGFNCRKVTGNPYAQSPHSYGTALDVNTVQNPYRDVHGKWWPKKGKKYIDRSPLKAGMLSKNSTLTKSLRKDHFFWGGFWNPGRDYQHFQR